MARTTQIDVVVLVDEQGRHAVGIDSNYANEDYENRIDGLESAGGLRMVRVKLTVPVPEVIDVSADVSGEEPQVLVAAKVA